MCPCAVPVVIEVLPFALGLIALLLLALAKQVATWLYETGIPAVGMFGWVVLVSVWRWTTGAVLSKPLDMSDADYWTCRLDKGLSGPRVQRHVRAVSRLALSMSMVGVWVYPVPVSIALGAALVSMSTVAGVLAVRRHGGVRLMLTGRARARIGS